MPKNKVCKIIQITDTHLFADQTANLWGVACNQTFMQVVQQIRERELADAHCVFLTGDLSQDETPLSYSFLTQALAEFPVPIYWIPGNHDDMENMATIFQAAPNFHSVAELSFAGWYFIFLDSRKGKFPAGNLSKTELLKLQERIISAPAQHSICVVMHHHPYKVGTPLIDQYILENHEDFWKALRGTQVKLIICGHVHGDYQLYYQNIAIESAPATCLQWKKGVTELVIEEKSGYKIYYFYPNDYRAEAKFL